MTEAEWLACADPEPMLEFLRRRARGRKLASARKLRLFACGCCGRVRGRFERAVRAAEGFADGWVGGAALAVAHVTAGRRGDTDATAVLAAAACASRARTAARTAPELAARLSSSSGSGEGAEAGTGYTAERAAQADLLRDVIGDPFRPVTADPRWLTSTAVSLARTIYADRAFDRLPILADALEDAGCDHTDVLAHLRGDGPHVRGCWVVDLVLGKK